jgi:hypothetical protein
MELLSLCDLPHMRDEDEHGEVVAVYDNSDTAEAPHKIALTVAIVSEDGLSIWRYLRWHPLNPPFHRSHPCTVRLDGTVIAAWEDCLAHDTESAPSPL